MLFTKIVHLREEVAVGLVGIPYCLMTGQDEDAVKRGREIRGDKGMMI